MKQSRRANGLASTFMDSIPNLPTQIAGARPPPPPRRRIVALLKASTESRSLNNGKAVHARLIKSSSADTVLENHLINLYSKCGRLRTARKVFDKMPDRNIVSAGALMAGYLHGGLPSEALSVLKLASSSGQPSPPPLLPNEYVLSTALACCSTIPAIEEGRQCHAFALKSGLVFHPYVRNALLDMYCKCSAMDDALEAFDELPAAGDDIFSLNSMMQGFLETGRLSDAMAIFGTMVNLGISRWDHVAYIAALGLAAASRDAKLGQQLHNQVLQRGVDANVFARSRTIDMYGKCGDVSNARRALDDGSQDANVVSWTAAVTAFEQNEFFEEAMEVFVEMTEVGIRPNELTYLASLSSCAGLSSLRTGEALHGHAAKSGFMEHTVVGNALINMYSKSGSVDDAGWVFSGMRWRGVVSWNMMITGYSHHGFGGEALKAFHEMLDEGEVPTYVTFVGVLLACSHLGLVEDGFYYFDTLMRGFGVEPGVEHYTCIVRILTRAGRIEEADEFMRRHANVDWDVVAWRTLLSACQVHRCYGIGERVAERILQLGGGFSGDDPGTHLLLSNMFANANRWREAAEVRKLMEARKVKKEPGVSWVQVRGRTHVFASGDEGRHPLIGRIREKVSELVEEIKLWGYAPITSGVLRDVGEEEEHKESHLLFHSEKLAVAFGLMSLPEGAPIRIMKNLRMCEDCHSAVKFISDTTGREIVVRDVNLYHHFRNGACSCHDHW